MQWQDVLADKSLRDLPYKIELNEYGHIEMSPASFTHSRFQGKLAALLSKQLGGEVFTELAIVTDKGVKVPDVAWSSGDYYQQHKNDIAATSAPEICIEIIVPSNNQLEMRAKIQLYLKAGAIEVWLVNEQGDIQCFDVNGQCESSGFNVTTYKLTCSTIDCRNVDYIGIMEKVTLLKDNIEEIKAYFKISISQDLYHWYGLKSNELVNIIDNIKYQLSDKNDNIY
jgi:Uma2 family endonuclease